MSANKYGTRYDEEFKRTTVNLYQNGSASLRLPSAKNTEFPKQLLPAGSGNTQRFRLMTEKFLPPNKSESFRNATSNLRRKTSF